MKFQGGCYCGQVRYVADGEPAMRAQCHCRECQYISGGGPNFCFIMPNDRFCYTQGQPATFMRSDLKSPIMREFCGNCGTHLASCPPGISVRIIKVGTLDDPTVFVGPQLAMYTVDKQPFHMIPDGIPKFERSPRSG